MPLQPHPTSFSSPAQLGDCAEGGISQLHSPLSLNFKDLFTGTNADPGRVNQAIAKNQAGWFSSGLNLARGPVAAIFIGFELPAQPKQVELKHRLPLTQAGQWVQADPKPLKAELGTIQC